MRSSASLGAFPQPGKSKASECGTASPLGGQEGEQHTADYLKELVKSWHVQRPVGIYSVCSAHPWVLEAAMEQAIADNSPLLIEATSNQVNHLGGYTGMTPADFRRLVEEIAQKTGFKTERQILGGDHLGPN